MHNPIFCVCMEGKEPPSMDYDVLVNELSTVADYIVEDDDHIHSIDDLVGAYSGEAFEKVSDDSFRLKEGADLKIATANLKAAKKMLESMLPEGIAGGGWSDVANVLCDRYGVYIAEQFPMPLDQWIYTAEPGVYRITQTYDYHF